MKVYFNKKTITAIFLILSSVVFQVPTAFGQTTTPTPAEPLPTGEEILQEDPRGGWEKTLDTEPTEIGDPANCEIEEAEIEGLTGGSTGGGLFVPVHEVGEQLSLIRDTNAKIAAINGLLIDSKRVQQELCVHLKAIRRIQYRIEEKEFVDDANTTKVRVNATVNAVKGVVGEDGQLQTSRAQSPVSLGTPAQDPEFVGPPAPNEGTPGYVENMNRLTLGESSNMVANFRTVYEDSGNVFRNAVLNELKDQGAVSKHDSTMTAAEINALVDNPTTLEASDWWDNTTEFAKEQNNPFGAYTLAIEAENAAKATAENNARAEYMIGQGFVGSRECAEWADSAQQSCLVWRTTSPGSIIKDYVSALLTSALRQVEQADENIEDVVIGQLSAIQQNGVFSLADAGKNSITEQPDPCPPEAANGGQPGGPCPTSPAWGQPDGSTNPPENAAEDSDGDGTPDNEDTDDDNDGVPDNEDNDDDGDGTPDDEEDGGGDDDDGNDGTPDDSLPGDNNPPGDNGGGNPPGDNNPGDDPVPGGGTPSDNNDDGDTSDDGDDADGDGIFNADEPQVWLAANTATNRTNTAITWTSLNADACQADNDWISKGATADTMTILKKSGDSLALNSASAPVVVLHPINPGITFYKGGGDITANNVLTASALNGLIQTATVTPPGPVTAVDQFNLFFKADGARTNTTDIFAIGLNTQAAVVNSLDSGIKVNALVNPLIKTTPVTNLTTGFGQLGLRPVPTYKIKCTKTINGRVNVATGEKTLR